MTESAPANRWLEVSPEVAAALREGRPVVALETSIVAHGLPAPHNLEAGLGCEAAIRAAGAQPATIAVLGGRVRVGLSESELRDLASAAGVRKVSSRDLGWAAALGVPGATTVAATMRAAALAGIRFMATGGIGGVHRGHPEDVSGDIAELARSQVAVFCAGAKTILDLRLTVERLETEMVTILGYGTDELPGFYTRHTGIPVSARVEGAEDAARAIRATWATGGRGILVGVPPPRELDDAEAIVESAVARAGTVRGGDVTPRILALVAELSGGASLSVNVELVVNNARAAAATAVAYESATG